MTPIRIGDVRLSELKRVLAMNGFSCQFARGGVLVVDDAFVVRRGEGGLCVFGRVCEEYYKLRGLMYEFQALVA